MCERIWNKNQIDKTDMKKIMKIFHDLHVYLDKSTFRTLFSKQDQTKSGWHNINIRNSLILISKDLIPRFQGLQCVVINIQTTLYRDFTDIFNDVNS